MSPTSTAIIAFIKALSLTLLSHTSSTNSPSQTSSHRATSCKPLSSYLYTQYSKANTQSLRTLFIVSVLGAIWAIVTLFRRKSTRDSAIFVSFIDLCFVGAFIAGVYELRSISKASCTNFSGDGVFSVSLGPNGVSGTSGLHLHTNKTCAMLKASFAFGIMNCIFFFVSSLILLTMHRSRDRDVVVTKETYSRRRSHGSR